MTTKTMLAPLLGLSLGLFSFVGVSAAADQPAAAPGKPVIDATAAPKLPARAKIDWEKMNEDARKKYMKATVLPQMKKLFVGFDKKYKTMTCMTCHGEQGGREQVQDAERRASQAAGADRSPGFMALHAEEARGREVHGHAGEAGHGESPEPRRVAARPTRRGSAATAATPRRPPPAAAPAAAPAAPAKPAGGGW